MKVRYETHQLSSVQTKCDESPKKLKNLIWKAKMCELLRTTINAALREYAQFLLVSEILVVNIFFYFRRKILADFEKS